jgi:hypothetical protein
VNLKEQFLKELVQLCSQEQLPILVGGDFNMLQSPSEKNNDNYDQRWPFLFNSNIDGLNLRYWVGDILGLTEWEQNFPLANAIALSRDISDHTPRALRFGSTTNKWQPKLIQI